MGLGFFGGYEPGWDLLVSSVHQIAKRKNKNRTSLLHLISVYVSVFIPLLPYLLFIIHFSTNLNNFLVFLFFFF